MRKKGAPHSICVKIKSFDYFHFFKAVLLLEIHIVISNFMQSTINMFLF